MRHVALHTLPTPPHASAPLERGRRRLLRALVAAVPLLALVCGACSVRKLAVGSLASTLGGSAQVFSSDDDPELVREALPFALKTIEVLLAEAPENEELLRTACSTFTQYAVGFLLVDAEKLEDEDYRAAEALRQRSLRLLMRGRDYGLRALEVRCPGISEELPRSPETAVQRLTPEQVATAYWTAAAWGSAITLAMDDPQVAADLEVVRQLIERGLELDEGFDRGALHEAMIAFEAIELIGGSPEKAGMHFERAVELSRGERASPYVTYAESFTVARQDRAEFERLLTTALAVDLDRDPAGRLNNVIQQRRARWLLGQADDLFLEPFDPAEDLSE